MPSIPKNTWYCSTCKFYVFNSKPKCDKCLMQKPVAREFTSYDPAFDRSVQVFFQSQHLAANTSCSRCKSEGRVNNNQPMRTNHNCWKYS